MNYEMSSSTLMYIEGCVFFSFFSLLFRKMTVTASKHRLYVASLPECPPHSIVLRAMVLNLTMICSGNV